MSDIAIKIENLGKVYKIGRQKSATLIDSIRSVFSKNEDAKTEFWALKDISFEIKKGEAVAIIGRNGAGKSTLLKVLSRITEPSKGRFEINGRVSSLLEVGTGFHHELTGRENIFLNGTILGMKRAEIRSKFDEIVEFSGVADFLDTPVKHYSSGMYVRLAFAVAAHLEPEILIVDEVLAVGDAEFQKRCLGKMKEVTGEGRTVIFVSHNMGAVRNLCSQGIFLEHGQVKKTGGVNEVVDYYFSFLEDNVSKAFSKSSENKEVLIKSFAVLNEHGKPSSTFDTSKPIVLRAEYTANKDISGSRMNIQLLDSYGNIAFTSSSHSKEPVEKSKGDYVVSCIIPADLLNGGEYKVQMNMGIPGVKVLVELDVYASFTTTLMGNHGSTFHEVWPGIVAPKLEWEVKSNAQDINTETQSSAQDHSPNDLLKG